MNDHSVVATLEFVQPAVKSPGPIRRGVPVHAPIAAASAPTPARPIADKRQAILAAALRLIARTGLHNTPMSALAREAGVAAGTLYLYFPSKEAMINALYLQLLEERHRATTVGPAAPADDAGEHDENAAVPRALLWQFWHALARWYLDHPDASNVIQQCRVSSILTEETRAAEQRAEAADFARFDDAVARGLIRPSSRQVCYALVAGPIAVLVQLRDAGELAVDDAVLRATFDGVCRSVLPPPGARGA